MQAEVGSPIACSLPTAAMEQRLAWIRRITASSLRSHQLEGTTLTLQYRIEALPELRRIIKLERQCCSFLEFALRRSADTVQLTIAAPGGVGAEVRSLFDQFLPQPVPVRQKPCGCAPGVCG